jgi:hypothetical protein
MRRLSIATLDATPLRVTSVSITGRDLIVEGTAPA